MTFCPHAVLFLGIYQFLTDFKLCAVPSQALHSTIPGAQDVKMLHYTCCITVDLTCDPILKMLSTYWVLNENFQTRLRASRYNASEITRGHL